MPERGFISSRRTFLKVLGATGVAAGLGLGQTSQEVNPRFERAEAAPAKDIREIATVCHLCVGNCGIVATVADGRVIKIDGNPKDPNNRGRLCPRGQAALQLAYDPYRLRYPMERAGERGEGKWKRITWDEALKKVADRLRPIKEKYPERLTFARGRDMMSDYTQRFVKAFGSPNYIAHDAICMCNRQTAYLLSWGDGWPYADYANSRYIVIVGSNPAVANITPTGNAERLADAKAQGATIICADPRLSETAARATQWIPIVPGTDGAFLMGLINVLLAENLYDKAFVQAWTVGLEGLTEEAKKFSPEEVGKICDIAPDLVREVARGLAANKPKALVETGRGTSSHLNGTYASRAGAVVNTLLGNVDQVGGMGLLESVPLASIAPEPPDPKESRRSDRAKSSEFPIALFDRQHRLLFDIAEGKPYPTEALITYYSNLVFSSPDVQGQVAALKKIPFIVSIDAFMSETTSYADIILPDASDLERWDLFSWPYIGEIRPYLKLRQPVIAPMYESRFGRQIIHDLALAIGGGMEKHFADEPVEFLKKRLAGTPNGPTWDQILKDGIWVRPSERGIRKYEQSGFKTTSKKAEIFCQTMKDKGFNPYPTYVSIKAHQDTGVRKEYPFYLINYKLPYHTQSRSQNLSYLMEIASENYVLMHPTTAGPLNIKDGDLVWVESKLGKFQIKAKLTEGIRPDTVAIPFHFGHWEYGDLAKGKGANPNSIIPSESDGLGENAAFNSTLVKVYKA